MDEGLQWGVLNIEAVYFDVDKETCMKVLKEERKSQNKDAKKIWREDEDLKAKCVVPDNRDAFSKLWILRTPEDIQKALEYYSKPKEQIATP
jgi:hypothetical protein